MADKTRLQTLVSEGKFELTRQLDWLDTTKPQFQIPIVVVGCGGIGSPTVLELSKNGYPFLTLIDDDVIEAHNLPNQLFPLNSIGKYKVDMAAAVGTMFGPAEIQVAKKKVQEVPDLLNGIVITGLDSMASRQEVWKIVRLNKNVKYLLDARLGGLGGLVWAIDPNNTDHIDQYEQVAMGFDDTGGEETACTARAVIHVAFRMAAEIGAIMQDIFTGAEMKLCYSFDQKTHTTTLF